MTSNLGSYCLDTNVLIVAWHNYYSPEFCPSYWEVLTELGRKGIIYLPQMVAEEISRVDDDLSHWLQNSGIPIHEITESVTECLTKLYSTHPSHKYLVDNIKQRSIADPWVIAHALSNNSSVVTKEALVVSPNPNNIRIPNVCSNLGVKCLTDFEMIKELNISFACSV